MSTVYLKENYSFRRNTAAEPETHKAGAVVSVPFALGKQLVEDGIAAYAPGGLPPAGLVAPIPPPLVRTSESKPHPARPARPE